MLLSCQGRNGLNSVGIDGYLCLDLQLSRLILFSTSEFDENSGSLGEITNTIQRTNLMGCGQSIM